MSNSFREDNFI